MSTYLTDIRALLSKEPTLDRWGHLCQLFAEHWDEASERDVAIAYAADHLASWPDALRTLSPLHHPWMWTLDEEASYEDLYQDWQKVLLKTFAFCSREHLMAFIDEPYQPSVWGLELSGVQLESGDWEKLVSSSVGKGLKHLRLRRGNWDQHTAEMADSGIFSQLESVGFVGIGGEFSNDMPKEAALLDLFCERKVLQQTRQLELSHGFLSWDTVYQFCSRDKGLFPKLETLYASSIVNFAGFDYVMMGLRENVFPSLKHLHLPKNEIMTRQRFESTLLMLLELPQDLLSFDLSNTTYSDAGFSYLHEQLPEGLEWLEMSGIRVEADSGYDEERDEYESEGGGEEYDTNDYINWLLNDNTIGHCKYLGLASNGLKAKTLTELLSCDKVREYLEVLRIGGNAYSQKLLTGLLTKFSRLRVLSLGAITEKTCQDLLKVLKKKTVSDSLETIAISRKYDCKEELYHELLACLEERGLYVTHSDDSDYLYGEKSIAICL
jgi:hypothetical protein